MCKDRIYCEICQELTKYDNQHFTKYHLKVKHALSSKEYYDTYVSNNSNDKYCKTCGKELRFKNIIVGYGKGYCSNTCILTNRNVIDAIHKTQTEQQFSKYGMYYVQTEEYITKTENAKLKKYGDSKYCNPNKIKETFINKYGVDNFSKTKKFREIMEKKGLFISLDDKSEFEIYRLNVNTETRKWKKILFENWDGFDYYTKDILLNDPKDFNNPMYRTIDHKISIYYGFNHNIDPLIIGYIDNLCITSRSNNSIKKHRIEEEMWEQVIDQHLEK